MNDAGEFFSFDNFSLVSEKSEDFQNEIDEEVNSKVFGSIREKNAKFVELILQGMGMEKHMDKFLGSRISLETFLNLNQSDLINVGITDAEDIKIILENLENYSKSSKDYNVPLNLHDDIIIAKNVWNQMVRLQAYAAFLVLKLTKEKFIDYEGDKLHSPSRSLKHFTNSAISQCDKMARSIYEENESDNLIKKLLEIYSIDYPKILEEKKKKQKTKSYGLNISTAFSGLVCVAITAYFFKERLR